MTSCMKCTCSDMLTYLACTPAILSAGDLASQGSAPPERKLFTLILPSSVSKPRQQRITPSFKGTYSPASGLVN